MRLLLIDETRMARACYRLLLERLPEVEEVREAVSVEEALERWGVARPDMILIDIDSVDGIRSLAAKGQGVPMIAVSSRTDSRRVDDVLQSGASAFVHKKDGFSSLHEAIRVVLHGEVYLSKELLQDHEDEDDDDDLPRRPRVTDLTKREREVLGYVANGHSSRSIAGALGLSLKTVETHRLHISKKLDIHSVARLTKYAIRSGLSEL